MSEEERREYNKKYREANKEKIKENSKQYYEANKETYKKYYADNIETIKENNKKNREVNKEKSKQYREANIEKIKQYNDKNRERKTIYYREYRKKNKQRVKNQQKKWRVENKEHTTSYLCKNKNFIRERSRKYLNERRNTDPLFKMSLNLRHRTSKAFKYKGYKKSSKTQDMLGVDWEVCKAHIERQFKKGMKWSNYGEWHIDHYIPLASAKNEKELIKLCYYRNLQPLWAVDNLSKGAKIIGQQSFMRI